MSELDHSFPLFPRTSDSFQLSILKQHSVAMETVCRNGIQKKTHVVAKNLPFIIDISAAQNLSRARISVTLLYDSNGTIPASTNGNGSPLDSFGGIDIARQFQDVAANPARQFQDVAANSARQFQNVAEAARQFQDVVFKPVDTSLSNPVTSRAFPSSDGLRATVEVRLSALSSKHENSLFRLKISAVDLHTNGTCSVISEPIRCVSKIAQITKGEKPVHHTLERSQQLSHIARRTAGNSPGIGLPGSSTTATTGTARGPVGFTGSSSKRKASSAGMDEDLPAGSATSSLLDTMLQLHRDQQAKIDLLVSHLVPQHGNSTTTALDSSFGNSAADDLEVSFLRFLDSYQRIPIAERSTKLRRVMESAPFNLAEELARCAPSPLPPVVPFGGSPPNSSDDSDPLTSFLDGVDDLPSCDAGCPHTRELEQWELRDFYSMASTDSLQEF